MFQFFESIKVKDGVPYHLEWHQQRVDRTVAEHYPDVKPFQLSKVLSVPREYRNGIVKARCLYNETDYQLEFSEYRPRKIATLKIVTANDVDYSSKHYNRDQLMELFEMRGRCDDILMLKDGLVTDTSYSNIVFFNNNQWVTPAKPLLRGTTRERLIHEEKIVEAHIALHDIHSFSEFRIFNAMLNFEEQPSIPVSNIKF